MIDKPDILYTGVATAMGGRAGHSRTSDGRLDVDLDVQKELGGDGGPGTNPEQLLAAGWAACFQSSMMRYAGMRKVDLSSTRVIARIGIGTLRSGGLGLAAALDFDAPDLSHEEAVYLMERAHESCPYSRATRGNIEVTLTVGGTSIVREAA